MPNSLDLSPMISCKVEQCLSVVISVAKSGGLDATSTRILGPGGVPVDAAIALALQAILESLSHTLVDDQLTLGNENCISIEQ
jgi:hypothetical protein